MKTGQKCRLKYTGNEVIVTQYPSHFKNVAWVKLFDNTDPFPVPLSELEHRTMTAKEKILELIDEEIQYCEEHCSEDWSKERLQQAQKLRKIIKNSEVTFLNKEL